MSCLRNKHRHLYPEWTIIQKLLLMVPIILFPNGKILAHRLFISLFFLDLFDFIRYYLGFFFVRITYLIIILIILTVFFFQSMHTSRHLMSPMQCRMARAPRRGQLHHQRQLSLLVLLRLHRQQLWPLLGTLPLSRVIVWFCRAYVLFYRIYALITNLIIFIFRNAHMKKPTNHAILVCVMVL